jgi:hypothetical protein
MKRDLDTLRRATKTQGDAIGMTGYFPEGPGGFYDHSTSQFAVLGLWGCTMAGGEVSGNYWHSVDAAWRKHQYDDGSWSYRYKVDGPDGRPTLSMTAAGVATLLITQDQLSSAAGDCSGNRPDPNIDRGMAWLGNQLNTNFDAVMKDHWNTYVLYGLSRIGVAGYKYIGTCNWFDRGADWLVHNQAADGSWNNGFEGGSTWNTAFAVLFLARGRAPVLINKLQYDLKIGNDLKPGNWNQRPRDVANLTSWLARHNERGYNWQVVNLSAPVDELFDARILYLAGDQPIILSPEHEAKLKQFIEDGGLIWANADCSSATFINSLRRLGSTMFPAYEFRDLPSDHLIYTAGQYPRDKWKSPPGLQGLSNGVRELILLTTAGDPGKAWHQQNPRSKPELYQLAVDVTQYATEQQDLRSKGRTFIVRPDPNTKAERTTKVARLQYHGNWDPEPGGWRRLAAITHNRFRSDLDVAVVSLGQGKLTSDFKAAHLTGTGKLELSDAEKAELQAYVKAGGTLIVDAAGGDSEFATSAEALLMSFDGGSQLKEPLAPDSNLFNVRAQKNAEVVYRRFAMKTVGKTKYPRLRGIETGGRISVFFSPEDLSAGLVGMPLDGIRGYAPDSAVDCMASIVLYAGSR